MSVDPILGPAPGCVDGVAQEDLPGDLYMYIMLRRTARGFERSVQTLRNLAVFDLEFPGSIPLSGNYAALQGLSWVRGIMRRSEVAKLHLVLEPFGSRLEEYRARRLFLSGTILGGGNGGRGIRRYEAPDSRPLLEVIQLCEQALHEHDLGPDTYWHLRFSRQREALRCDFRLSAAPPGAQLSDIGGSDRQAVQDAVAVLVNHALRDTARRTPVLVVVVTRHGMVANFRHPL